MNKKISFGLLISIFTYVLVEAQGYYPANVSTPNGSSVIAYIMDESSDETRASFDSYWNNIYPNNEMIKTYYNSNSTIKYSSTRRFNCHGYAWHMSTLSDLLNQPRWIGKDLYNTDEHIYWNDNSYVEVANATYPGMISWQGLDGDHSAITTNQQGIVISKWNEWPFMRHKLADSPFGSSGLKYYVRLKIDGPTYVCKNTNFTLSLPPMVQPFTVSWSYSGNITLVSSSGNQAIFKANSDVSTWIKANVTVNGKSTELTKNINIDAPPYSEFYYAVWNNQTGQYLTPSSSSYYDVLCYNTTYHIKLESSPIHTLSNYQWTIPSGWTRFYTSGNMISINTNSNPGGQVSVSAITSCGVTKTVFSAYFGPTPGCSMNIPSVGVSLLVFPNPAKDIVTIQLKEKETGLVAVNTLSSQKMNKVSTSGTYEIQLWSTTSLIKTYKTDQLPYQISVNGLLRGLYVVIVIKDGEIYRKKLLVQ